MSFYEWSFFVPQAGTNHNGKKYTGHFDRYVVPIKMSGI